jgi:hypothetical protein
MPDLTWTDSTSQVNWLKDILPGKMPQTRIMQFGYDSIWLGKDPIRTSIESIATLLLNTLRNERKVRNNLFLFYC